MKSKEFKELQKLWYKKLADSGFEDIEWVNHETGVGHNSPFLKHDSHFMAKRYSPEKQEYFYRCEQFLNNARFENGLDFLIFYYHTQGLSIRETVKKLDKGGVTVSFFWIRTTLEKLKKHMKNFYSNEFPKHAGDYTVNACAVYSGKILKVNLRKWG